jgi:hypothetical protein
MLASLKIDELQENLARFMCFWCFLMHHSATWPINGHYQCRKCHRIYGVPWSNN